MKKKILFIINNLSFFKSHRIDIAKAALDKGHEVIVLYGELGRLNIEEIKNQGIKCHKFFLKNKSLNPICEIKTIFSLYNLLRLIKPDLIHCISIKCYLYGGFLARILKIKAVVIAIAGLGILAHLRGQNWFLNKILFSLFSIAFSHSNQKIIVQNENDLNVLNKWGVLNPEKVLLIKSSGVDINKFIHKDKNNKDINICFAARLLKEKGIFEFIEAAKIIEKKKVQATFIIAGEIDPNNPTSIKKEDLNYLTKMSNIKYIGFEENISLLYQNCDIVCLPSYYGEGVPKSLIEAAASSRAIITTDHPGCRDAVIPNKTGLLVPIKNSKLLADAIIYLIKNPKKRIDMGKAGRKLAEKEFNINKIIQEHFKIYEKLFINSQV